MSVDFYQENLKYSFTNDSTEDTDSPKQEEQQTFKSVDPFNNWGLFEKSTIEIKVNKPILREELFSKYLVYKIQGNDKKGYFEVSRRYSDFEKIRNLLVTRWPGCFIPSLPPKVLQNMEEKNVEDRTKFLHSFCQKIAELPHLHYSDVYQIFIRTHMVDLDPVLYPYLKIRNEEVIKRYKIVFPHLLNEVICGEAVQKIMSFNNFLTKIQGLFENFKKVGKKFVTARTEYTKRLIAFHDMMATQYESSVFSEYHDYNQSQNVFLDSFGSEVTTQAERMKELQEEESVGRLYEWIKSETRDITAFKEAIAQRDKYKTIQGKTEKKRKEDTKNLQNVASSLKIGLKYKDENISQIENKINNESKDIGDLIEIQDWITLVLAYEEIEKFKSTRVKRYTEVMLLTAGSELTTLNATHSYWQAILENKNVQEAPL